MFVVAVVVVVVWRNETEIRLNIRLDWKPRASARIFAISARPGGRPIKTADVAAGGERRAARLTWPVRALFPLNRNELFHDGHPHLFS